MKNKNRLVIAFSLVFIFIIVLFCVYKNLKSVTPVVQKSNLSITNPAPTSSTTRNDKTLGVFYENKAFGYSFAIPDGGKVDTEGVVLYPIAYDQAIELAVDFKDQTYAGFSAMVDEGTFPDIRGLEKLTAEEFVTKWQKDNEKNAQPVFKKEFNGIQWFGFRVDHALDFANHTGGQLLDAPWTVVLTKHNNIFYRWQFESSIESNVENVLNTFEFTN